MSQSTIAFFGATGGCANACLALTLRNGHKAIAMARTPSKLTAQLLEQPGLTQEILDKNLRIQQGDATNVEDVMKTLIISTSTTNSAHGDGKCQLVSTIISGIGGAPTMSWTKANPCDKMTMRIPTLPHIELNNPHITEESTRTLLEALRRIATEYFPSFETYAAAAPRVTIISGTGIGSKNGMKDVPLLFRPMYWTLLPEPHADKSRMEALLNEERGKKESLLVGGLVVVRPSFLRGDHRIAAPGIDSGYDKLRVGTDESPAAGVGYLVDRALIGEWIFEEVVKSGGDRWVDEGVILTC
ncbi:hypothetical protein N7509_011816 [Penicillium cosmopolitanum]|uniref:NAD(P)-binding domain-containing protein n=1 Tax=Penicillium cosmopolitanum TaxID=1131564 RepID=A0A9W9SHH2_9EURO|nr:uncharacterized protein N7509_011816 [Penicillium cosmopolitanum]KAJ5378697.1 hypothetical protein N7509_011816 [Penicillium cosmopolitanum]